VSDPDTTSPVVGSPAGSAPASAPPGFSGPAGGADEFAGVPSPRARHPLIALGAVALAAYLVYEMRHDLGYAFSSSAPIELGDARLLKATPLAALPLERYVRVSGVGDRESALTLDTPGSWRFVQFFRLLGSRNRVFVSRAPDPLPPQLAERDVFLGRLVPFRDLSFQSSIRRYFATHVTATHFFRSSELATALGRSPVVAADLLGESVTLEPSDELAIAIARPGEVRIELPHDRFPTDQAARVAVESRGGRVSSTVAPRGRAEPWLVTAAFATGVRDRALSEIGDVDRRVRIRPAQSVRRVKVADLVGSSGTGLAVRGEDKPLEEVLSIRRLAPVEIPPDAVLIREGDRPRDHLKTIVVVGCLLAFAAFNALAFRRRR